MLSADDPPEVRGRVFDVQRCSVHDGPGIRTTVFLSGCALRCQWCHNPESWTAAAGTWRTAGEVLAEVRRDRAFYEASGGVTLSGGEPLLQPRFAAALLSLARAEGLHTCVQTAGAAEAGALLEVLPHVDLFQFDLKHLDPERHRALTGEDTARVHASARLLVERGAQVEFRVPLVPGLNDSAQNLDAAAGFVAALGGASVRLVPYQNLYLEKYARLGQPARCAAVQPPTLEAMNAAAARFRARGLAVERDG